MGLPNNLPYDWADDDSDKCKKNKNKTKKTKKADALEKKETRLAYVSVCQGAAGLESLIFAIMFEYDLLLYLMAILFILALFHTRLCLLTGK